MPMIPPPSDPVAVEKAKQNSLKKREEQKVYRRSHSIGSSHSLSPFQPEFITENRRKIEELCRDLEVNNDHIHVVEQRMRAAIQKGLTKARHEAASVKCFPTYVRHLPTGNEQGRFLALDLGGTNFRVLVVDIDADKKVKMDSKVFAVPPEVMVGTGDQLFDHIASCLAMFVKEKHLETETLPLGFTFSFPCKQEGLAVGRLTSWTKGFKCSGVEGEDVVDLLKQAIARRGDLKLEICAILNDTTGCLMACAWKEPKCRIGLILGTGTNACYLEDVDNVETWDGDKGEPRHVIINTEWGAFGDHGELEFIRTKWDKAIDQASINPGKQTFEKMISGMYMGEIARQVLVEMVWEGLIFEDQNTDALFEWGNFQSKYVSKIEADPVGSFDKARKVLSSLGMPSASEEDCSALRYICELVSRRAGFMASAGITDVLSERLICLGPFHLRATIDVLSESPTITALLKKMDYHDVVVAIDGSVFRHHPHFPNIMRSRIAQLMGVEYKFDLMLSTDGSGRGAALVAAVLKDQENK